MSDPKLLSEDERQILERYEHEAQCGNIPLNYRVTFDRLAAERERNRELVEVVDHTRESLKHERERNAELVEALEFLYDKWENGDPCFENPDEHENSLGNAFRLSYEEENSILALIPSAKNGGKL